MGIEGRVSRKLKEWISIPVLISVVQLSEGIFFQKWIANPSPYRPYR